MPTVYIGIGSNIEPEKNIPAAISALKEHASVRAISTFYVTEPLQAPPGAAIPPVTPIPPPITAPIPPGIIPGGMARFHNGVVQIETDLAPRELKFGVLRAIEESLGRVRTQDRYAPRTIDLDILVYDDLVVQEHDLVIPDPDILTRPFIAIPLHELAPDLILPGLHASSIPPSIIPGGIEGTKLSDVVESMSADGVSRLQPSLMIL